MTTNTCSANPAVSVVIPVMNTAAYLPALFDALSNQTLQDIEFVLINDGSTDNSGTLLDDFAARDPRARVVHTENVGVSRARNTGIRCARGRYVAFCDSDDLPDAECYGYLLQLAQTKQVLVVIGNGQTFRQQPGDEALSLFKPDTPTGTMLGTDFLADRVAADNMPWTVFLALVDRTWLLGQQLFFPEGIVHEDVLWYTKLLLANPRIHVTNSCHYHYRQSEASITRSRAPAHLWHRVDSYCQLINALIDLLPSPQAKTLEHIAFVQFQHALWVVANLPRPWRMRSFRLLRHEGVLARLWPLARQNKDRRRIIRCWIYSWFTR